MRISVKISACIICLALLFVTYKSLQKEAPLAIIEHAISQKDWLSAEKLLHNYLSTELDMEKSWQAWLLLLEVSKNAHFHDDIILSYLQDMMVDYGHIADKKKYILFNVSEIKQGQNNEKEAIKALQEYANLRNLTADESFLAYEKLLKLYFRQGDFSSAEDVLNNCLTLQTTEENTAYCMYNLAEIYAGKGSLETAQDILRQLEPMEISLYKQSQVNFLQGDILEQQRKYKEALLFFKLALEYYGNKALVQERINALEKLVKKK